METKKGVAFWLVTLVLCFLLAVGTKERELSRINTVTPRANEVVKLEPQKPLFTVISAVSLVMNQKTGIV